ncbi:FecR domain-containing protein [Pedobacter sp. MC2016-14]|uniref:FecR family protein n=1 Tax=Pedobacter sp. MC2016-14 TaxID=2897327 RepID=UPI001E412E3C|nr:FecR domain-containing protein [Pedobacter sp. MC2016-14]MCD0488299.1 FecR domain-containing protein [Pedobacter sp. MC2016-14]
MTQEEQAKELLKKYLNKELDPIATKQVEEWYNSYEQDGGYLEKEKKAVIAKQMQDKLQQVMHTSKRGILRLPLQQTWLRVAAAIAIISGLAVLLWPHTTKQVAAEQFVSISTSATQKKNIKLADGSEICLSPSSKLLYPAKFSSSQRVVELAEGEAFFKVAHEAHRGFIVKTSDDLQTKVLGTSFTIKSYHAKGNIEIVVATGKVSVGNTQQTFGTLIKGQQLSYHKQKRMAMISYTPQPVYTDLVFEGTTLQKAIKQLEYAYSINIVLNHPDLYNLKCAAVFNTRQKPEEILDILCSLHHLKFNASEDHKTFNIYRKMKR